MRSVRPDEELRQRLSHVLWVGGSPCAGKSSVTKFLGRRYGVQTYHVDNDLAKRLKRPGALFSLFLLLYGLSRFAVDFLRYYDPGNVLGTVGGVRVTIHQALSAAVVIVAAVSLAIRRNPKRQAPDHPST